ncbi:MAG: sulfatase-like hydrolase/transferase [Planctomycetales bacterium]|nr:sulfatase-like hydrolase/transferase [Planctomycetales bacterium]
MSLRYCALGCLVLIASLSIGARSNLADERPNVVVIFTDDHGWSDLGIRGIQTDLKMPNIDALARGGVHATAGYVTAPQCVPSRAGLLTGRWQNRFGVESNGATLEGFGESLTIAERLKRVGYATGMSGKWHLGPPGEVVQHGFDDVYCNQGGPQNTWCNFDLKGVSIPGGVRVDTNYHLDANSQAACAFIRKHQDEPFFFYLAYRAPHVPLDAPPKYLDRFSEDMPHRRRQCLAMLSAVDDGVGQVMDTLRELDLEKNTLVFFIGDNGAPLKIFKEDAPGGGPGWDGSLNEPMNGEKGMLSEGGIRVPWIASWPGVIQPGQSYSHPVISLDVAATVAAVAGAKHEPNELDGVNLIPYFSGQTTEPPHQAIYWRWVAQAAVRRGDWKLLVGGTREYLFNLARDPSEQRNELSAEPEIASRLRSELSTWSQSLQPPGLATERMSTTWEQYFDHYLEHRPMPPEETSATLSRDRPQARTRENEGWVVRNASTMIEDGKLRVQPQSAKRAFIAFTGFKASAPLSVEVEMQCDQAGKLGAQWRTKSQKDFVPSQTIEAATVGSSEPQSVRLNIESPDEVIHLRLLLPAPCGIHCVSLRSNGELIKTWKFQ